MRSVCLADGEFVHGVAWHRRNQTVCVGCAYDYCQSCSWGCPFCKLGQGLDRRAEARQHAEINVVITPEKESA